MNTAQNTAQNATQTGKLSSASGLCVATRSRVCAAPVGSRRPCSHSWSVRRETPKSWANRACDRPTLARALAAAVVGTCVTRANAPDLNSRTDCSKSAWNCSISASGLGTCLTPNVVADLVTGLVIGLVIGLVKVLVKLEIGRAHV